MRPFIVLAALGAIGISASRGQEAPEPEVVTIPLDKIWGYDMPGTRDVSGIDLGEMNPKKHVGWGFDDYRANREAAIERIRKRLFEKANGDLAPPGLVFDRTPDADLLNWLFNQISVADKQLRFGAPNRSLESWQRVDTRLLFLSRELLCPAHRRRAPWSKDHRALSLCAASVG